MSDSSIPPPAMAPAEPLQDGPGTAARDTRLALIHAYQDQALKHPNPLAANLGVINGDLMELVYRLRQALDSSASRSPADFPQLAQQVDVLLRTVRQVDRLAQLERQLATAAESRDTHS
jgi:hypothetical protein